jgi:hypothetical protein
VPAYLRDANGRVAGLCDDESAPVQAAWVQPGLMHQPGDGDLVIDAGTPDPVLHGLILALKGSGTVRAFSGCVTLCDWACPARLPAASTAEPRGDHP